MEVSATAAVYLFILGASGGGEEVMLQYEAVRDVM